MIRRTAPDQTQGSGPHSRIPYDLRSSSDDVWAKTTPYDFNGVVIDYELKSDIAAAAIRQRFITLDLATAASSTQRSLQPLELRNYRGWRPV